MKRAQQAPAPEAEQPQRDSDRVDALPHVLFIPDLCRVLGISRSTVEKLRRHGCFPIPELPPLDKRPRWGRLAVEQFLASSERRRHGLRLAAPAAKRTRNSLAPQTNCGEVTR